MVPQNLRQFILYYFYGHCLTGINGCVISMSEIEYLEGDMTQVDVNYLAILVCGVVFMVLGALWYSPILFSRKWMTFIGKSEEEIKKQSAGVWKAYLISAVGALVMAYVLAHIIHYAQADTALKGLQTGLWVWLGFVVTSSLGGILFEGRPKGLYFLYNGYQLVSLLCMGVILSIWK